MNKQLLSELKSDYKKLYYVVNNVFSIKELMAETQNKNIYCPFHGESRQAGSKPSARFYDNVNPIKLWCFQERRSYYSYHYIKLIMKRDPLEFLIKNSSEKKIIYYLNEYKDYVEEEDDRVYQIDSIKDLNDLYNTLNANQDYSKWYIV